MSSQVSETGFQPSPPTSTPTMVRSRPKLPTIFGAGGDDGVEDLVGVISTLGSTDFTGKYSTNRRKRTSVTTTAEGAGSPSPRANACLPMSPMSPALSPRTKSPPPDGKATITLTRMRSIKLKLEEVKERQDRAAEMNLSGNIPRRKTGTVEPPCLGLAGVCLAQESTRDNMQPSSSTPSLDRSESDRSDKTIFTSSPSVIQSISDSQEKVSDLQSPPEKEKNCLLNRPDICLSGSITQNIDSNDPVTKTSTDIRHQHRISDSSKSNVESSTERDSDSPLHVTEDEGSLARRKALIDRASHYAKNLQKDNGDSSNEMEDEGIGAMDIEEDISIDPHLLDKLSQSRNVARSEHDKTQESPMDVPTLPGKSLQILPPKLQQDEFSSKGNVEQGVPKRGNANGRFLTHPPSKEKPVVTEGGSVDSNGLGSLRTNKEPVKTNDLTSQVSELSIDSHLCPSDTSETPTYRDVVIDITSEPTEADKFERKNNKSFKHKSKSDPSGEKQKILEGVDLPIVLGAHAKSEPTLPKEEEEESPPIPVQQNTEESKTKSIKSEHIVTKPPKSPHPHISRLKETQITRSTSEESSEESLPPVQKLVKARRALKKRRFGAVELPKRHAYPDRDSSRHEGEDSPSPGIKHEHAATVPTTPTLSPESTLDRLKAKTSLTLPIAKKSGVSRSHSSAIDYGTRPAERHDGFKSPNLGARPKSSDKVKLRKGRPPIPEPLSSISHKSFTWAGSGSTPDLNSPRQRGDRATYSPRLDTIFSGSSLSLFEGAAEDKVSSYENVYCKFQTQNCNAINRRFWKFRFTNYTNFTSTESSFQCTFSNCQSIYRISDYTRSFIKDESPTRL